MKSLIKLIGKAPSELTPAELILRIKGEHQRVNKELEWFGSRATPSRSRAKKEKKTTTKGPSFAAFQQLCKEMNLPLEEAIALLKKG